MSAFLLTPREETILGMRAQGLTLRAIAERFDVSAGRVREIEQKALKKRRMAEERKTKGAPALVVDLDLPERTRKALTRAGIDTVAKLSDMSIRQLLRIHGLGRVGIRGIRNALEMHAMALRWDNPSIVLGDD